MSLRGELDAFDACVLQAHLSETRWQGWARCVADLAELVFIDRLCLGVLVRHGHQIRSQGGSFALAGPQAAVLRVLSVTGLLGWFEVHGTVDEALAGQRVQSARLCPGKADVPVAEPVPMLPAPAAWTRPDLAELNDRELLGLVGSLSRRSEQRIAACELLVSRYQYLVRSCVQPYRGSPEPIEDLMQVGYAGLVAAINNFDPAFGCTLATYAHPHITGEIKRYFRDKRWQIHVARPVKSLAMQVRTATWQLTQELGRTPTEADLARYLGVGDHELRNAQLAEMAFQPSSLDAPMIGQPGAPVLADVLGGEDPRLQHMLDMQTVAKHWPGLPPREQQILLMRFYGGMTQDQIGQQLGISQMHVSRLISHALGYLRPRLLGLDGHATAS